ncbi:MAG: hypothetical protein E6I36_12760 [Chloroflexi bacterium]|nr:MAG: hypothetical protein E6I36_12760 [Chloroflexota bacterium]
MRRVLVGAAAIVTSLGWLQLAAAFGFPVTAPAAMLDRMLGAQREAGPAGWVLLLLGEAALAAAYFLVVEPRTRGVVAPIAYGLGAWLLSGAVLMPIVGLIQGAPPAGDAPNDPMRATFFMLNLGPGAAVESLVAWLLFGAVLAAGRTLDVRPRVFYMTGGAVVCSVRTRISRALSWTFPAPPRWQSRARGQSTWAQAMQSSRRTSSATITRTERRCLLRSSSPACSSS